MRRGAKRLSRAQDELLECIPVLVLDMMEDQFDVRSDTVRRPVSLLVGVWRYLASAAMTARRRSSIAVVACTWHLLLLCRTSLLGKKWCRLPAKLWTRRPVPNIKRRPQTPQTPDRLLTHPCHQNCQLTPRSRPKSTIAVGRPQMTSDPIIFPACSSAPQPRRPSSNTKRTLPKPPLHVSS